MATCKTIALLALLATATVAQQYNGNYVENDYDYDQGAAPAPPPRPAPAPARSYSRPAPQPLRPGLSSSNLPRPTPVPILKQINRHNEDGSYTYGYEGADGSFKIETKLTTGEVMGKYGYVDDVGKVRVVEYGANKFGFQPSGEGITVAPPTLVDESTRRSKPGDLPEYDDGSYFEQPAPRPVARARPAPPPVHRPAPQPAPRPIRPAPPPPQPKHQYSSYEASYEHEQSFAAPGPIAVPRPAPRPSSGPVPPRAVVPGAAPVPAGPPSASFAPRPAAPRQPAPVRPQPPVYHAQPVASFAPAPAPQRASRGGGGILDQLARDYALPQGGAAPLTDISFSSFY